MAKTEKMPAARFAAQLAAALERRDGYIMGATGQDPRNWPVDSWWFDQYDDNPKQKEKALYWRAHAPRVWDCNGLAEGLYRDYSGVSIDTRARCNYADWCDPRGDGRIPARFRTPGAAVFWGDTASKIHHVAFLYRPAQPDKPDGDWLLIEARGVMYGVVETRLYSRRPDFWGWMTRYFDYSDAAPATPQPGGRTLRRGDSGEDVRALQAALIRLGFDCGRWGADGDFGADTARALREFQRANGLEADGVFGPKTRRALQAALDALNADGADSDAGKPSPGQPAQGEKPDAQAGSAQEEPGGGAEPSPEEHGAAAGPQWVAIRGGNCYVRAEPGRSGRKLGVVHAGERLPYAGETDAATGWLKVRFGDAEGWVSGKYGRLTA